MVKDEELTDPKSCLNKAFEDEPLFVLRAKDPGAPQLVRMWARNAKGHTDEKIKEAFDIADDMDTWRDAYLKEHHPSRKPTGPEGGIFD